MQGRKGMGQEEETRNSARNLDVALLPLNQRLLFRASENSQTGIYKSIKITGEKQYGRYTSANARLRCKEIFVLVFVNSHSNV